MNLIETEQSLTHSFPLLVRTGETTCNLSKLQTFALNSGLYEARTTLPV